MRKKQGLLVILDGLGDRPNSELHGKTPLESAVTPNFDFLVSKGMCGNVYPMAPGVRVGTDVGHLQIFGYDSNKVYSGRGPLEAFSAGMILQQGDIAFRGNFGTVDENLVVVDRRAGRIREGTGELAQALHGMVLEDGTVVQVKALTEHRVAVVFQGSALSDRIVCTDPGTAEEGAKLVVPSPLEDSAASRRTAANLWEFTKKAQRILEGHPVNGKRKAEGLLPANTVITRGPGMKQDFPTVTEQYGLKAACVAGDTTVGGIARLAGMDYYTKDSFTGSFDTDLSGKADLVLKLLKEDHYDWVVLHVKATDLAGHDNLPLMKKEMVEKADAMMGRLLQGLDLNQCYITFTADHSTPCEARDHTGDAVPTFIAGGDVRKDGIKETGETPFMGGSLQNLTANDIFMLQMDLLGFTEKVGA